jgi:hypothetical protein
MATYTGVQRVTVRARRDDRRVARRARRPPSSAPDPDGRAGAARGARPGARADPGAQPALRRPLYTITAWRPMIHGVHDHALLLTTWEGLQFAVSLDADLRAQSRAHLALLDVAEFATAVH